jgi:phosphoribosylglycinamide formyltransferase-1
MKVNLTKIALFASGSGTNAQNIIQYFADNKFITIDSLWSNNPKAYALTRAQGMGVKTFVFNRHQLYETDEILKMLQDRGIDMIVLAGFLWLVPEAIINNFKIINIHPALLPKYGGKGMYGMKVHQAVVDNKEPESGITIHYVDNIYDNGKVIFQAKCKIEPSDTPEMVARKIHQLEYEHFPVVIENLIMNRVNNNYNTGIDVK